MTDQLYPNAANRGEGMDTRELSKSEVIYPGSEVTIKSQSHG